MLSCVEGLRHNAERAKNGPKTARLRHDQLHHPLRQSPKRSNRRIIRGSPRIECSRQALRRGMQVAQSALQEGACDGGGVSTTLSSDHASGTPERNKQGSLSEHGASQSRGIFRKAPRGHRRGSPPCSERALHETSRDQNQRCVSTVFASTVCETPRAHVSPGTKRSEAPSAVKGRQG